MIDELMGQPLNIMLTGTAAANTLDLRPAEGEAYIVFEICFYHDDPAGLTLGLYFHDGTLYTSLGSFSAVGVSSPRFFRNASANGLGNQRPLVLTRSNFIRLITSGIAAGKKLYIEAAVYKIRGLPIDTGV